MRNRSMVICPKCRSDRTAPILHGYPSHEVLEAEERGELILGGCEMIDGMPHEDYGCLDCRYRWSKELLSATQITKIRYKVVENGPCTTDSQQSWVYEIYPDGRCKEYTYQGRIVNISLRRKRRYLKRRYTDLHAVCRKS